LDAAGSTHFTSPQNSSSAVMWYTIFCCSSGNRSILFKGTNDKKDVVRCKKVFDGRLGRESGTSWCGHRAYRASITFPLPPC
jgi:hypothetical protein